MALSLRIIDTPKNETVTRWNVIFPETGGTIGRKYGSTLQLNDSRRIISSEHARIERTESGYRLTDVSTNGVYLNRSSSPLGRSRSIVLNDGDVLGIGDYLLLVSVDDFGGVEKSQTDASATKENESAEIFDPFGTANSDTSEQQNIPKNQEHVEDNEFPDPFLNVPGNSSDDPFITANSYNYQKNTETRVSLEPKDHILDSDMEFEIRPDPFVSTSSAENHIKPNTPEPLMVDRRNMFGGNPFNRNNDIIDTPLGDLSDSYSPENTYISMNLAIRKKQSVMEEAMAVAFNRILEEIDPEHFEEIYSVFNRSRIFFLKPKYWPSYKDYFAKMKTKEWHSKFVMYFREALEILSNKER